MGQKGSVIQNPAQTTLSKGISGEQPKKMQELLENIEPNIKNIPIKCDVVEQLAQSRLQKKIERELEMSSVRENKEQGLAERVILMMESNQEQFVEILDERVQLIIQNFEEKFITLENKVDEIRDKLNEFESVVGQEMRDLNPKEGINALRNEVKQMVALSEKYIKDDNQLHEIQNLSNLTKAIHKESKPNKNQLNPYYSKFSRIREKSKLEKQMSTSQILRDLNDFDQFHRKNNDVSMIQISSIFNGIDEQPFEMDHYTDTQPHI